MDSIERRAGVSSTWTDRALTSGSVSNFFSTSGVLACSIIIGPGLIPGAVLMIADPAFSSFPLEPISKLSRGLPLFAGVPARDGVDDSPLCAAFLAATARAKRSWSLSFVLPLFDALDAVRFTPIPH